MKKINFFFVLAVVVANVIIGCQKKSPNSPSTTPNATQTAAAVATQTAIAAISYTDLVSVPGGTFIQQSDINNDGDVLDPNESFNHTISTFKMGKYQVTYELWYTVCQWAIANGYTFQNAGTEGSGGIAGATTTTAKYQPVTTVNWRDCIVWCNALSQKMGLMPVYYSDSGFTTAIKSSLNGAYAGHANTTAGSFDNPHVNWDANGYRLPTEGEYQYAASYKDGISWTPYNYASGATADYTNEAATDLVGWDNINSGGTTNPVGILAANALGIYDMSGNVLELCWDWYGTYPSTATIDYKGPEPASGPYRMLRGGAFLHGAEVLSLGFRNIYASPYTTYFTIGFRFAAGCGNYVMPTSTSTQTSTPTATITMSWTPSLTQTITPNAAQTAAAVMATQTEEAALISVPGGTFTQTDASNPVYNFSHTISAFNLGKYEVTYDLWYTVYTWAFANGFTFQNAGTEGSRGTAGFAPTAAKYQPVTNVNWRDAIVWCNAYSEKTGLSPVYCSDASFTTPIKNSTDGAYGSSVNTTPGSLDNPYVNWGVNGYRLPTESEYQYAASYIDGTSWTPYNYASGAAADYTDTAATNLVAWNINNSGTNGTHSVGGFAANALGIYDMSGNAWEWCWDWYGNYPLTAHTDYTGPASSPSIGRVNRGGNNYITVDNLQVGHRSGNYPYSGSGFRFARTTYYNPTPTATLNALQQTATVQAQQTEIVVNATQTAVAAAATQTVIVVNATQTEVAAAATQTAIAAITYTDLAFVLGGTYTQTDGTNSFSHAISSFKMGKYQVTYNLWSAVYQWALANGYGFQNAGAGNGDLPVTIVSWRDAVVWCNAYSQVSGLTPCYMNGTGVVMKNSTDGYGAEFENYIVCEWANNGYRLPSEGEYQYAASYIDGTNWTPYNYASGATADTSDAAATGHVAWYVLNSGGVAHDVGVKTPNALGIYDMSGNIYEWCWDWYDNYPGTSTDYKGPTSRPYMYSYRVLRGGSYHYGASDMQVGSRSSSATHVCYTSGPGDGLGFRIARTY